MNFLPRLKRYPVGSRVKRKNGPVMVKMADGTWESEQRVIWQNSRDQELVEGDRVFFIDGNPENRNPKNLTKVRFGAVRFRFREESGVLYVPTQASATARIKVKV